ncbi:hypothetical protein T11_5667 [Trichinella zimbabwensis]|uniref:Uncharacterized protein n=1 Tax=Trichinella zimbabwensis TaxID=268475 RepID=A0A0V1HIQ1_9BILA|nr:hypothetical protein T11_5667 [Trichinella zimbabwensis]
MSLFILRTSSRRREYLRLLNDVEIFCLLQLSFGIVHSRLKVRILNFSAWALILSGSVCNFNQQQ